MQTHYDSSHNRNSEFWNRLQQRADEAVSDGKSKITAGASGEEPLAEWKHKQVSVTQLPPDEQDILRISIGGMTGEGKPIQFIYCNFRGPIGPCIAALQQALEAMKKG